MLSGTMPSNLDRQTVEQITREEWLVTMRPLLTTAAQAGHAPRSSCYLFDGV